LEGVRRAKVIDWIVGENYPAYSGLVKHVALKAALSTISRASGQETVFAESLIQNANFEAGPRKPLGKD